MWSNISTRALISSRPYKLIKLRVFFRLNCIVLFSGSNYLFQWKSNAKGTRDTVFCLSIGINRIFFFSTLQDWAVFLKEKTRSKLSSHETDKLISARLRAARIRDNVAKSREFPSFNCKNEKVQNLKDKSFTFSLADCWIWITAITT